jgi:hypothetical protein
MGFRFAYSETGENYPSIERFYPQSQALKPKHGAGLVLDGGKLRAQSTLGEAVDFVFISRERQPDGQYIFNVEEFKPYYAFEIETDEYETFNIGDNASYDELTETIFTDSNGVFVVIKYDEQNNTATVKYVNTAETAGGSSGSGGNPPADVLLNYLLKVSGASEFFNESDGGGLVFKDSAGRDVAGIALDENCPQLYIHRYNESGTLIARILVEVHDDGLYISTALTGTDWVKILNAAEVSALIGSGVTVEDVLTSSSASNALSANMGRELKLLLDEFQNLLDAIQGVVTYLNAHDFGDPESYTDPTFQDTLADYAKSELGVDDVPNSTDCINLWNGHEWIYNITTELWIDYGPASLVIDDEPTAGSGNAVSSGGVYSAIGNIGEILDSINGVII